MLSSIISRARGSRRRGGAYTIAVLSASTLMLAVGSTLLMPTRLSLEVTELRRLKLAARELARSGLEWAGESLAAGDFPKLEQAGDEGLVARQKFSLSSGAVEVELRRAGPDLLVIARGVTKPSRKRQEGCQLTVRYGRSKDRWVITAVEEAPIAMAAKKNDGK